jgi:hypothetical protein
MLCTRLRYTKKVGLLEPTLLATSYSILLRIITQMRRLRKHLPPAQARL